MKRKLGLFNGEADDEALIQELLEWMHKNKADFTNTFAGLGEAADQGSKPEDAFLQWHGKWQARLSRQPQSAEESARLRQSANPAFIPRNHLVEAALAAAQEGDLAVMERLLEILKAPYDHSKIAPEYRVPDPSGGTDYRTFCGT